MKSNPPPKLLEVLVDLPDAISTMFRSAENDSFDLGEDWFDLLNRTALPSDSNPVWVLMDAGEADSYLLPLLRCEHQLTALSTFYTSLYRPLVGKSCPPTQLSKGFRRALTGVNVAEFRLRPLDPAHPTFSLILHALRLSGCWPFTFRAFGNWYLPSMGMNFDQYQSRLATQTRNTLRRKTRKFLADQRGRLELITGGDELESAIANWVHIYNSSWKKPEPYSEFIPELIRLCARRGWLRMGIAYYDGQLVAAQIWIVNGGRASIYKLAYDEAGARFSAGTILTGFLMRQVLDVDRVSEVDYLIGDDPYKKEWMTHRRERWGIVAYNLRSLAGWAGLVREVAGRVWKRMGGIHATA